MWYIHPGPPWSLSDLQYHHDIILLGQLKGLWVGGIVLQWIPYLLQGQFQSVLVEGEVKSEALILQM